MVEFVDWFLSDGIGSVEEADYIPLDDAALAGDRSRPGKAADPPSNRMGGRVWPGLPRSPMLSPCTRALVT